MDTFLWRHYEGTPIGQHLGGRGDRVRHAALPAEDYDGDGVMIGRLLGIAFALFAIWTFV